jgi:hypothetical protein
MASQHTGHTQPSIDLEEHRSINGVNAKAVVEYVFDGSALLPRTSGDTTLRYDDTSSTTYTYIGKATPGSLTSAPVWQVKRLTNADTTIIFADGNSNFDNIWDNRVSLSYS